MEYECQVVPIDQSPVGQHGFAYPLCNSCVSPDCTNPIREENVSVFGVVRKVKLYVINNIVRQVIACKGYTPDVSLPLGNQQTNQKD